MLSLTQCEEITQNRVFWTTQKLPQPSAKIGTSHGVLRNFGPEPPPPKIGISHGGLRNFGPKYTYPPPHPKIGTSPGGLCVMED